MTQHAEQTKGKLRRAFEDLLEEKPYDDIVIKEIAQRAGRTRVTVYRHYADKEAILLDCFRDSLELLKQKIAYPKPHGELEISPLVYTNLLAICTYVNRHRALYRALLIGPVGRAARTQFRRVVIGILFQLTTRDKPEQKVQAPPALVFALLGEMVVGGIAWWLESEAPYEPAVLAEMILRLGETGTFGLMGQEPLPSDISYRPFSLDQRPPTL